MCPRSDKLWTHLARLFPEKRDSTLSVQERHFPLMNKPWKALINNVGGCWVRWRGWRGMRSVRWGGRWSTLQWRALAGVTRLLHAPLPLDYRSHSHSLCSRKHTWQLSQSSISFPLSNIITLFSVYFPCYPFPHISPRLQIIPPPTFLLLLFVRQFLNHPSLFHPHLPGIRLLNRIDDSPRGFFLLPILTHNSHITNHPSTHPLFNPSCSSN